jgi:hypothetical protein
MFHSGKTVPSESRSCLARDHCISIMDIFPLSFKKYEGFFPLVFMAQLLEANSQKYG